MPSWRTSGSLVLDGYFRLFEYLGCRLLWQARTRHSHLLLASLTSQLSLVTRPVPKSMPQTTSVRPKFIFLRIKHSSTPSVETTLSFLKQNRDHSPFRVSSYRSWLYIATQVPRVESSVKQYHPSLYPPTPSEGTCCRWPEDDDSLLQRATSKMRSRRLLPLSKGPPT